MSISLNNINSFYNNYNTNTGNANALEDTLNSDLSAATEDELMEVCKEFEAYFTEQVFKSMSKMVPESDNGMSASSKQLQDYYKDEMVKTFAESSVEGGGLGLAQTLYEQMKRNYNL